jgi:hypothetical protein
LREALTENNLVQLDSAEFAEGFARRPFRVRHSLVDHPLLTLEAIAELADRVPLRSVERHQSDLPQVMPGGAPDLDGRPSDTVRGIETNGCWMVLWYLEQVPEYKALLDEVLDEAQRYVGNEYGGMCQRELFLFLSAPDATTPLHFDPEHNFLLQIRGTKQMNVGRFVDPSIQQLELDRYHDGGHRNLENVPTEMTAFDMSPGEGVYVYPFAPHWVKNGPTASISLSVTFRTQDSRRTELIHRFNARLRRLHMSPRSAGSARTDVMKATVEGWNRRIRHVDTRAKRRRAEV